MKKILIIFLFCLITIPSFSAFYTIGSNVSIYAYRWDNQYYLILSFNDHENHILTDRTIVKFKMNDGSIIKLEGYEASAETTSRMVHWGLGIATGSSTNTHFAILSITPEQIEQLKKGVDKVAINSIPKVYKRSKWSGKSEFGNNLYNAFKKLKDDFDE